MVIPSFFYFSNFYVAFLPWAIDFVYCPGDSDFAPQNPFLAPATIPAETECFAFPALRALVSAGNAPENEYARSAVAFLPWAIDFVYCPGDSDFAPQNPFLAPTTIPVETECFALLFPPGTHRKMNMPAPRSHSSPRQSTSSIAFVDSDFAPQNPFLAAQSIPAETECFAFPALRALVSAGNAPENEYARSAVAFLPWAIDFVYCPGDSDFAPQNPFLAPATIPAETECFAFPALRALVSAGNAPENEYARSAVAFIFLACVQFQR